MCNSNEKIGCHGLVTMNDLMKYVKVDDGTTRRKYKSDRVIEINLESIEAIAEEMKKELNQNN